ncbi:hypothetical protein [Polyangium mundeleinium]|uniref:Uncharacterized protein n=1 Tax=Polyangium mundeleinium TaxID=2995306 RepID=A0ABT5F166_9BACT|nr:hypothetical protein [Polyangium mundeleinium]MDC0747736.1 hypothetical protein [Polyangium mundeleinium]
MKTKNRQGVQRRPSPLARLGAWLALGVGFASFAGSAGGCGPGASDICELKCACQGCTEAERDDCISDIESTVTLAESKGCSDKYDAWLVCVESEAECRDGETFAFDGCDIEEDALAECGGGNQCTAAAKKLCSECNFVCSDPDPDKCTGQFACESACIVNATCAEIASPTPGGTFDTCMKGC